MQSDPTQEIVPESDSFPSSVAVLIPAWQPGSELVELVRSLAETGCGAILVVDDGSSAAHRSLFEQVEAIAAVHLLRHDRNRGKGSALKMGMRYFLSELPAYSGLVTADADGQHAVADIARVATVLAEQPQRCILGVRRPVTEMPLRSRFGNALTRHVFRAATGVMLADTQTGLRGLPKGLLPEILSVRGERYEFEMAMLLCLCGAGHLPAEVPIRTLYTEGNRSSHFRPVKESAHVYKVLARHWLGRSLGWKPAGQEQLSQGENHS